MERAMSTEHTNTPDESADGSSVIPLAAGTAIHLPSAALGLADLPPEEVRAGSPKAGSREIHAGPGLELGIWEMTTGTAVDTEVDECFLVLAGSATVTVQPDTPSEAPTVMELRAGTIGRLAAGMRTEWVVHESLRKVYLMPTAAA